MRDLNIRAPGDPGYRKITLTLTVNSREADNLAGWLDDWGWEEYADKVREVADICHTEEQHFDQIGGSND